MKVIYDMQNLSMIVLMLVIFEILILSLSGFRRVNPNNFLQFLLLLSILKIHSTVLNGFPYIGVLWIIYLMIISKKLSLLYFIVLLVSYSIVRKIPIDIAYCTLLIAAVAIVYKIAPLRIPVIPFDNVLYRPTFYETGNIPNVACIISKAGETGKRNMMNLPACVFDEAFDAVIRKFVDANHKGCDFERMHEIDEFYSTIPENSDATDKLVEEWHCDGHMPNWMFEERTYRFLIFKGKDEHDKSYTHICKGFSFKPIKCGDYLIFDYNCEAHRAIMKKTGTVAKRRYFFKVHFVVFKKGKDIENYKKKLVRTNRWMRRNQNSRINPRLSTLLANIKNLYMDSDQNLFNITQKYCKV